MIRRTGTLTDEADEAVGKEGVGNRGLEGQ